MTSFINDFIPYLILFVSMYVMHSKRIDTKHGESGAIFAVAIVMSLFLMAADWRDDFQPVLFTTLSRLLFLVMTLLVIKLITRYQVK